MVHKMLFKTDTQINILLSILLLGLFTFLMTKGAIFAPDSSGYVEASITRSPGYPFFIKLIQFLSKEHTNSLLVGTQLCLGFLAALSLAKSLQNILKLDKLFFILFTSIFLTPYLGNTGNYVLTEGLAYPLFLFSVQLLFSALVHKNNTYLASFFLCVIPLSLTRGQFLFMYIVGFIALLYFFSSTKSLLKKLLLTLTLIFGITSSVLADKAYHYFYHNEFTQTPFFGVHLIIMPFYISEPQDIVIFKDSKERDIFSKVHHLMEEMKLSHSFHVGNIDSPYHFYTSFDAILYNALFPALGETSISNPSEREILLKNMSVTLIKQHPLAWFKMYIRNVASHLWGYYGGAVIVFLFLGSCLAHFRYRDPLSLCAGIISIIVLGNSFSVALVQALHLRYTFYAEVLLASILIVILFKGLNLGNKICKT